MSDFLRVYDPERDEFARDGYPVAWHDLGDGRGVKHLVREEAGNRCVRCSHPYEEGAGEWSPCDERCTHDGEACRVITATPAPVTSDQFWDGARVEARWRILTVHHLTGVKADLRWWNLAALCQRCHLTVQGRVRMERVYPWPHTEWFRPYVAGYYAWTYLGEEITRVEAMARMDELLALECVS